MKFTIINICVYLYFVLLNCNANAESDSSVRPSIEDVVIKAYNSAGVLEDQALAFWNGTSDNETSIIASKYWELAITCQATYPVEWVTTGNIDTGENALQVRKEWRETLNNQQKRKNSFLSRLEHPLINTGWMRCRSIENHAISTEIFLFVKDTQDNATAFVNSREYYKEPDPKIIPCGVTDPTLSVSLLTNGKAIYDAKYDPRIGFLLHDSKVEINEQSYFQCRVGMDVYNHKLNGLTILLSEPEESKVTAFDNQTLTFACKCNRNITSQFPKEGFNTSVYSNTENDVRISIRGKSGQAGKVTCVSEDATKSWEFIFYEKPIIYQDSQLNDIRCKTPGSSSGAGDDAPTLTSISCRNKNTCKINKKCLDDGKCSTELQFAQGDPVTVAFENSTESKLVQPPLSGLVQCSLYGAKESKGIFRGLDDKLYLDTDKAAKQNALLTLEVISPTEADTETNLGVDKEALIICKSVTFVLMPELLIFVVFNDGRNKMLTDEEYRENKSEEFYKIHEKPGTNIFAIFANLTEEVKEIQCHATYAHSAKWFIVSKKIEVLGGPKAPEIKFQTVDAILTLGDESQLVCEVHGSPEPTVTWKSNTSGTYNITNITKDRIVYLTIIFPKVEEIHNGEYVCEAWNRLGNDSKALHVTTEEPRSLTQEQIYGIAAGSSAVILILIGLIICLWMRYTNKVDTLRDLTDDEINQFISGSPGLIKDSADVHENAPYIPYNKKEYEIPIKELEIDRSDVLGSGAFGIVLKGTYKDKPVAVKITKPTADVNYFKALLSELKMTIYIGHHPNIVNFIGSFTKNIKNRILYIIMEYCPEGDLETYLSKFEKELKNMDTHDSRGSDYPNIPEKITKQNLQEFLLRAVKWSRNIADGMEYLTTKKVIHGDLAARNVILGSDDIAKVTDLGLPRQLYEYSNYKNIKKSQAPLSWRWMAIESLSELQFSSKSDCWSYGVTLWEIYSLGKVPYSGQSLATDFVEIIHKGTRLRKPEYASCEIFEVMCQCWSILPDKRPSFPELSDFFRQLFDEFNDNRSTATRSLVMDCPK